MANYNVSKLKNGVLINAPTGTDGEWEQVAFTDSEPDVAGRAKTYVDDTITTVAQTVAKDAKDRIDRIIETA